MGSTEDEALEGDLSVIVVEEDVGKTESQEEKRPKKRQKVVEEGTRDVEMKSGDEVHVEETVDPTLLRPRSRSPKATLPSFSLPVLPDAPSKSVLALQGLDRALVDAELINPTTVLPFSIDVDDDGGTGLSERMRKRLQDVGITELFAGRFLSRFHMSLLISSSSNNTSPISSPFQSSSEELISSLYSSS